MSKVNKEGGKRNSTPAAEEDADTDVDGLGAEDAARKTHEEYIVCLSSSFILHFIAFTL